MSDWSFLLEFVRLHGGKRMALATLVACEGSSYRPAGARMIVAEDGRFCGSISGGCLEEGIATVAMRVIRTGHSETVAIDTRPHFGCPGVLRVFIEALENGPHRLMTRLDRLLAERRPFQVVTAHHPPKGTVVRLERSGVSSTGELVENVNPVPRLLAIGWTQDMAPVLSFAAQLGWERHRIVRDLRMLPETLPVAGETVGVVAAADFTGHFQPDAMTAVLVMTHHLATDFAFLREILPAGYGYVGLLGSKRRRETLLGELGELGLLEDPDITARLHAPVGLDLGGHHPATIALAIVAEIQAVLAGAGAGFLRDKVGTIHPQALSLR